MTLVALTATLFVSHRPHPPPVASTSERPASFWHPVRRPPTFTNGQTEDVAPKRVPSPGNKAALIVHVEDATGGPIANAAVAATSGTADEPVHDLPLGQTDAAGLLLVPEGATGLGTAGEVHVRADGYAQGDKAYALPGDVRVLLLPGSQISGIVVERATGRPVVGIAVRADDDVETQSDAQGRFAFHDLHAGPYRLEARGPHVFGASKVPVTVGLGRGASDVRLEVDSAFTVRGRVVDQGQPVTGAIAVEAEGARCPVDDDGRYELRGLRPGLHDLTLRTDEASFYTLNTHVALRIVDRDVTRDIDVGRRHSLVVQIVDEAGAPVAGVLVEANEQSSTMLVGKAATTDAAGAVRFAGLLPGPVELTVHAGEQPRRTVTVPLSSPVRFVLAARGAIEGRLTTTNGAPPRRRGVRLTAEPNVSLVAMSTPDGRFSFMHLAPLAYEVQIYDQPGIVTPDYGAEATISVSLRAGEVRAVDIPLPAEDGHITGQVVDGAGHPLPDVLVWSQIAYKAFSFHTSHPGEPVSVTDPQGRFDLDGLGKSYRHNVFAYRPNGERASANNVTVGATVALTVIAPSSLTVYVHDATGEVSDGNVELLDGDEQLQVEYAGRDGVHLDGLRPGHRRVRLLGRDRTGDTEIDLAPGQASTVTLIR